MNQAIHKPKLSKYMAWAILGLVLIADALDAPAALSVQCSNLHQP